MKLPLLLFLSCALLPTLLSCNRRVPDEDRGSPVTLTIPLAPEQAVFLSGVLDDVAADVVLNDETVATGIRGGIGSDAQPGVRGGIRGIALRRAHGKRETARADPVEARRQADDEGAFTFAITFFLPPNSPLATSDSPLPLTCRLRSIANPDLVYLETKTVLEWAADNGQPETGDAFGIDLPDDDGDGVSNLVEVASSFTLSVVEGGASTGSTRAALEQAWAAATDTERRPTAADLQTAFQVLGQNLQTKLNRESKTSGQDSQTLGPLSLETPDFSPPETTITNEALAKRPKCLVGKELTFVLKCSYPAHDSQCTFRCSLDGGEWKPCVSSVTLSVVEGSHVLSVRAVDSLGTPDPTPAEVIFAVVSKFGPGDPLFPGETAEVMVSPQGGSVSADTGNVSLNFPSGALSADATLTVTKLDPSTFPSPSTGEGAGGGGPIGSIYEFGPEGTVFNASVEMRLAYQDADVPSGVDEAKLALATEVNGAWQVIPGSGADVTLNEVKGLVDHFSRFSRIQDTTPPPAPDPAKLTVTMNPPGAGDALSGAAGAVEALAVVRVYKDGLLTTSIGSGQATGNGSLIAISIGDNQADANNKIYLIAVDKAGNMSPVTTMTNDIMPPDTSFVGAGLPALLSNSISATFTFTSTDTTATFQCSVDSAAYSTCLSPLVLSVSKDGLHTFGVRAVDQAGNPDPTPASHTWTLDTTPPNTLFVGAGLPALLTNSTSASFSFTSNDTAATFACSLDGATFASCTSPKTYTSIPDGPHTFQVKATDQAGNESAAASYTWTINTIPPDTIPPTFAGLVSATAVSTSQIDLTWSPGSDNLSPASDITYEICRATGAGACTSTFTATYITSAGATSYSVPSLASGVRYYFVARARDQAGNIDANTTEKSALTWSSGVVQAISAHRSFHTCGLLSDGTVKCWGVNSLGQCGNGATTLQQTTPVAVSSLTGVVTLGAGGGGSGSANGHTCAVLSDGTVRCWGANSAGQLGDGTTSPRTTPVAVSGLAGAVTVAGGWKHTCAVISDGSVKCWGYNLQGQLGDGTTANGLTSAAVSSLTGAVAVGAGSSHTCALVSDSTVKCWGFNGYGSLGDGTTADKLTPVAVSALSGVMALAIGTFQTCALLSDGTVKCWGRNESGQLGDGTTVNTPTPVAVSNLTGATAIGAGNIYTCSLVSDGTVKCWGSNSFGQLGDGTNVDKATPVVVSGLTSAMAVTVGYQHTCSLLSDGTPKCWGYNFLGQLGDGTTATKPTPVAVTSLAGPLGVKLPRLHESTASGAPARPFREGIRTGGNSISGNTCVLVSDGTVRCWGSNADGQLGDGTTVDKTRPVTVSSLTSAVAVATRGPSVCALASDGSIKCWGKNSSGQLGDGTSVSRTVPVAVSGLTAAIAISAGGSHACALASDGTVKCWGSNAGGQLGDGTTVNSLTPLTVTALVDAIAVSAGLIHTCALLSDGSAKCWGDNPYGQLGDGTNVDKATPVLVSTLTSSISLASGGSHTCALGSDGTVKCWGANGNNQLGDGSTGASGRTPVTVTSLSSVVAITAGGSISIAGDHTCAVISDGTVKCWGANWKGQLGDGTTAFRSTPIVISGLSGVLAVSAGFDHTCGLLGNGSVLCWGNNKYGSLGDGTTVNRLTPVPVTNLP